MAKPPRTRAVSATQVRAYAGKAEEFAEAAASELEAGRTIAATSLSIHAAINAADAVCGARLRTGYGFRNFENYRLRLLLRNGAPWQIRPVASLRPRQPPFIA